MKNLKTITFAFAALTGLAMAAIAAPAPVKLRMSINDPLVPMLTASLGNFAKEGLEVTYVKVESLEPEDYLMHAPLADGRLDVCCHWFQQVAFGVRHNYSIRAVLLINDAPGMKLLVANRVKDQIKTAADMKGRNVAEGAGYATKSMITNVIARRAGLQYGDYNPVLPEVEKRRENVIAGLKDGRVDVLSFMEPMTSAIEETGLVSTLYDLTTKEGTIQALGAVWPAHCVFVANKTIEERPEVVQHLVNAFVRTLRFINSHTPEEVAAQLPAEYFAGKDRQGEIEKIKRVLPQVARGDYTFPADGVKFELDAIANSRYDEGDEGQFRLAYKNPHVRPEDLYTNRFAEKAMKEIK